MKRRVQLKEGYYYHIFSKSIAGFKIFMSDGEYARIYNTIRYYQVANPEIPLSQFILQKGIQKIGLNEGALLSRNNPKLVEVVAYCFMPTHIHFILKQLKEGGISNFIRLVLNSYTRYFNIKHKRNGPLWQGRFQNVIVESDEQLYHLTRYVHLNPVTANIVRRPEQWKHSSYSEYTDQRDNQVRVCFFEDILDIEPEQYRAFVNDQINYQKELSIIKHLMLE